MNEFYFDYQVFNETGDDVSERIKFFLDIDYSQSLPSVALYARILDWNENGVALKRKRKRDNGTSIENDYELPMLRFSAAKIVHRPHASDGLEEKDAPASGVKADAFKLFRRNSEYEDNQGKILVSKNSDSFSGTGAILFYTDSANLKDTTNYSYIINFFHKIKLRYTGKERGNQLTFKFKKPASADLDFYITTADNGQVPCLASETRSNDKVTLKKGSDALTVESPFPASGASRRYRLVLADPVQGQFFLLIDESVNQETVRLNDSFHRSQRCPFCLRLMQKPRKDKDAKSRKRIVTCQGNVLSADVNTDGFRGKSKHRICCSVSDIEDNEINSKYRKWQKLIAGSGAILNEKAAKKIKDRFETILLPEGYENGHNLVGCVLGASGVGKSIFLSRLMNITRPINTEFAARADAAIIDKAIAPYARSARSYFPQVYDSDKKTFDNEGWTGFFNKKDGDYDEADVNQSGLLLDYAQDIYGQITKRTDENMRELLQRHPFVLSIGRYSNVVLFDLPGEALRFDKYENGSLPTVDAADFLILLVNMDSKSSVENNLKRTSEEFEKCLEAIVERKRVEGTFKADGQLQQGDIDNIALAVVLCKFDELDSRFDVNAAVRTLVSDFTPGKYFNSEIHQNTNAASDEVERFLSTTANPEHYAGLKRRINYFKFHKFFAVSALGADDCIKKRDGEDIIRVSDLLYSSSPKRLEHVLLWLMWHGGIID